MIDQKKSIQGLYLKNLNFLKILILLKKIDVYINEFMSLFCGRGLTTRCLKLSKMRKDRYKKRKIHI